MALIPTAVKEDVIRAYGRYTRKHLIKGYLLDRTLAPMITLRFCQATKNNKAFHYFFRLLHRSACNKAGMDLPWNLKMKGGVKLTHGWGIVINGKTTIGKNVTLFNGVTLGGTRTGCPTIEDRVWIGPSAVVVGGVVIGEGSRIAANSFVMTDIPPYSLVSGNPAQIIRENAYPDVPNEIKTDAQVLHKS